MGVMSITVADLLVKGQLPWLPSHCVMQTLQYDLPEVDSTTGSLKVSWQMGHCIARRGMLLVGGAKLAVALEVSGVAAAAAAAASPPCP